MPEIGENSANEPFACHFAGRTPPLRRPDDGLDGKPFEIRGYVGVVRTWCASPVLLTRLNCGAKVCVVPLIAMVAERSGRGCLMTLRIAG